MLSRRWKIVIPTGFAIFAMLYGSGNLMFPLVIGKKTLGSYPYGLLGLFFVDFVLSLLGLVGIMLAKGNRRTFFSELPSWIYWPLMSVTLLTIGPLIIVPRNIHVAFSGGISRLFPNIPFYLFALFFCALIGLLIMKKEKMIPLIGKVLTPFKFGGILFITLAGLYFGPAVAPITIPKLEAAFTGIRQGYQIMDLLGIIFFSAAIYEYLEFESKQENNSDQKELLKRGILSGVLGLGLVMLLYCGFVILGAEYAPLINNLSSAEIFPAIADMALGRIALVVIAFTTFFATLVTAVALTNLFADFINVEVSNNKISRPLAIFGTLALAFIISLNGLDQIIIYADYILTPLYPILVIFTLYRLFMAIYKRP